MHTFDTLDKLPARCAQALGNRSDLIAPKGSVVAIVASGEAALAADLYVAATHESSTVPVVVTRGTLPGFVDSRTLVVALSETGSDTVTVDAISHAIDLGATVAVVAPGGHLLDMAASQGYLNRVIPRPLVPRTPLIAELFFGLWGLLGEDEDEAKAAFALLTRQRRLFGPEAAEDGNPARLLTAAFNGRQPLLYGTTALAQAAVDIWVDRLRSTGHPAHGGLLDVDIDVDRWPAMTSTRTPHAEALVLRDSGEASDVDAKITAMRKALGVTITVNELSMEGRTGLERLWGAVYLAEWTAFYLAP